MSDKMKAMVYYGGNDIRFEDRDKPTILQPTDAIIRMTKTTICGTDLGIWKGKNPEIEETAKAETGEWNGRILGHEGIGIVEEVGDSVRNFKKGDKVIVSCVSRCGSCENCQKQLYAHCENKGGWIMGYMIDGTQAEYVRTPYADNSLYKLPEELNEEVAVFLSDILPTGHEIGVQYGDVKPGDTIAIVGAGPVGMAVLLTSQFYSPANIIVVDLDDNPLEMAKQMGATHTINSSSGDVVEAIRELTGGFGADVVIDAVGVPETWKQAFYARDLAGTVVLVGVPHPDAKVPDIPLLDVFGHGGALKSSWYGDCLPSRDFPMLVDLYTQGRLDLDAFVTEEIGLDEVEGAFMKMHKGDVLRSVVIL